MTNLTQCPNCSSIFAISDEQYSASNGNVRCGSCREKFKVEFLANTDNLVLNKTILSNEPSAEAASPPHRQIELLRILSEHAEKEESQRIDDLRSNNILKTSLDDSVEDTIDSVINLDQQEDKGSSEDLFSNSFSENISTPVDSEYANFEINHSLHTLTLNDDDLLSEELLDEFDTLIEHKIIGEEPQLGGEPQLNEEPQLGEELQTNAELQENQDDYISDEDFTLKPSWLSRGKKAVTTIPLILICLILLSGLTYQLWLKQSLPAGLIKPVFAVLPVIHPIVEKVTDRYDLTLPVRTDLNNLQLVSAHTEAHPSRASTILLRVSFLNKAEIEQPLPDLELSLSDEDGRVVSRRTFAPIDYLYNNSTENIISSNELKKVTVELLAFPKQAHGYELKIVD